MIITQHGKENPLFKRAVTHNGIALVFFGWSPEHVRLKECQWLEQNAPVQQARVKTRPALRLLAGGKQYK